jgi:hypothetical protein
LESELPKVTSNAFFLSSETRGKYAVEIGENLVSLGHIAHWFVHAWSWSDVLGALGHVESVMRRTPLGGLGVTPLRVDVVIT